MGLPQKEPAEILVIHDNAPGDGIDAAKIASEFKTVGDKLAAVRKARGLSYQDVFNGTKVKIANVAAIETGDGAALPAVPYTAGFVKSYAKFLGLNPEEYAAAYRAERGAAPANGAVLAPAPDAPAEPSPQPIIATRTFAPAVEAPVAPRAARSVGPEGYVSYFGIGATILCALWIGARVVAPKAEPMTPEARIEKVETTAKPAKIETAAPSRTQESATPAGTIVPPAGEADDAISEAPAIIAKAPAESPIAKATPPPDAKRENKVGEAAAAKVETAPAEATETRDAGTSVRSVSELSDAPPSAPRSSAPADRAKIDRLEAALREPEAAAVPSTNDAASAPGDGAEASAVPAIAPSATPGEGPSLPAETKAAPPASAPVSAAAPKVVEAKVIRNAILKYPDRCAAKAQKTESVAVAFSISAEGRPLGAHAVNSTNPCFNSAAVDAAYDMRFSPRTENGAAVVQDAKQVTLRFER